MMAPFFCRSRPISSRTRLITCNPDQGAAVNSVRKMLARYEIHPRKRLGQSFWRNLNITRRSSRWPIPQEMRRSLRSAPDWAS